MATETSKRVPRWRQGSLIEEALPLRLSPTARRTILLLAIMGPFAGAIAGLISWLQPLPSPYFMPFWVVEYRSTFLPLNAAADRDRIAIAGGNFFARNSAAAVSSQDRHLMTHELAGLSQRSAGDSVVVYVSAYAGSDDQGVFVMPGDFDPDDPRSRIPLRELLGYLANCPANRQLLVFDIMWPIADVRLGLLDDAVAGCIQEELEQHPDPRRMVLCAASSHQVALRSEPLGRSAFGYYFEQALLGYADGYNSQNSHDGRVSVRELAAFVQARVGRWAWQARGRVQVPMLYGSGEDFELVAVPTTKASLKMLDKPPAYPAWLLAAWKLRDQWRLDGVGHRFPRICRQLEAQVLRSELQWRYGGDPARATSDLDARMAQLKRRLQAAEATMATPPPRLLSIKLGHNSTLNAAVVASFQELLTSLTPADPLIPAVAAQAKEAKLLQDFEQKNKDVEYPDLAAAVQEVIRQDGDPTAHEIRILDGVLRRRQPQSQFVETTFLHTLALLAEQMPASAWPTGTVRRALHSVDLSCRVVARSRPFRWIEPWLTSAADQQHRASIFLESPGYAPLSEADELFQQSATRYQAVQAYQDLVGAAYYTFDDAGTFLLDTESYLQANPSLATIWWSACMAAKELADVLETDPPQNDHAALAKSIALLRTRAGLLQTRLQMLGQPFSPERLSEIIAQCKRPNASPIVLSEANAILETPILTTADRTALWAAADELATHLDARVLALDATDNQRAVREVEIVTFVAEHAAQLPQTAQMRLRQNLGILALGGLRTPELDRLAHRADAINLSGAWNQATIFRDAAELRHIWADVVRNKLNSGENLPALDRLARVVSPFDPSGLLDDPQSSPIVRFWRQQHRQLWAWLGDYFRYELMEHPGSLFFQQAAGEYAAFADPVFGCLEIDGPKELPAISPSNPRVAARFSFHGIDTDDTHVTATIRWYQSDANALVIESSAQQALANEPFSADISWRSGADAAGGIPVKGFLLEVVRNGRSFHLPVSMATAAVPDAWRIVLSPNPQEPLPQLSALSVRPLREVQPFYLFVHNPGVSAREVIVQLEGDSPAMSKATVGPQQNAKISFTGSTSAAAGPLPMLSKSPRIKIIDAASSELLAERLLDVTILPARDYVQITAARFQPQGTGPNRLAVSMRDVGLASNPPSVADLVLPKAAIPGLESVGGGALRGVLPSGGNELTLFASKLIFGPGTHEQGRFYLTIDGRERAFIFNATFARQGDATTAQEELQPGLAIRAAPLGQAGPGFPVALEVDCPPVGATLTLDLGRGDEKNFQADLTQTFPSARDDQIRFSPGGPGGAMLVQASSQDWNVKLDTTGLSGRMQLRARLLDVQGRAVRTVIEPLTLDDTPPTGLEFDAPRAPIAFKTPFEVRAIGSDSLSGVSGVSFFVGPPVDGKIPPGTATVKAHAQSPDKTIWSAEMTLPEAPVDRIQISAQFTNGAGMSSFTTTDVRIVSSAILNQGRIAGKVMEGPRPQAGLNVVLKMGGPKGPEHAKTVTQSDGTFVFDQLTPGSYTLTTDKPISYRQAEKQVQVTTGKTTDAVLDLSIQAPTTKGA